MFLHGPLKLRGVKHTIVLHLLAFSKEERQTTSMGYMENLFKKALPTNNQNQCHYYLQRQLFTYFFPISTNSSISLSVKGFLFL